MRTKGEPNEETEESLQRLRAETKLPGSLLSETGLYACFAQKEEDMIVKIGKAYFDNEFRWGVVPCMGYNDDDKYLVILQNSVKVSIAANSMMVDAAMESLGYDPAVDPARGDILSTEEWEELAPYLRQGWKWLAEDRRGFVYFFEDEPELDGAYWEDPLKGPSVRMMETYPFLEEGDKISVESLIIEACLEEEDNE